MCFLAHWMQLKYKFIIYVRGILVRFPQFILLVSIKYEWMKHSQNVQLKLKIGLFRLGNFIIKINIKIQKILMVSFCCGTLVETSPLASYILYCLPLKGKYEIIILLKNHKINHKIINILSISRYSSMLLNHWT